MPVVSTFPSGTGAWALWEITEVETELNYLSLESCPDDIVFPQKRLEWLAGRALMRALTEAAGISYVGMRKDNFGKPFLKDFPYEISLSHSFPYVAAQWHPDKPVGIDLEQPKSKLQHVAPRVFSAEELADAGSDLVKMCTYWCAKEALFKLHGRKQLVFSEQLLVSPFQLSAEGTLKGTIVLPGTTTGALLGYKVFPEFVVVFTRHES